MSESLEVYDLEGNLLGMQDRDEFYSEIKAEFDSKNSISRKVKTIRLFLMNSKGRIYLQKRAKDKKENPGLYDKTVGGHVKAGHSMSLTVVQECSEELGFPAVVLSKEEFSIAVKSTDLNTVGIFKEVRYSDIFMSTRKTKGKDFVQPCISSFYVGYYDGPIQFCDGEATGIEVVDLETLQEDIKRDSERYTEDLKFMINEFKEYLIPINNG